MARRKNKKSVRKKTYKLGGFKKRKRPNLASPRAILVGVLKIFLAVCVLVAAGALVYFAQRYEKSRPIQTGPLVLVNEPDWVSDQLKAKIRTAAGEDSFRLDEEAARIVAGNLKSVAWLYDTKVQTTHDSIKVETKFRKPIGLIKSGLRKLYVDEDLVVLDFVPMPNLPIVKIEGLSAVIKTPPAGSVWDCDALAAAVAILARLDRMDNLVTAEKPLLYEIGRIDMSNFNGRQNSRLAHIIMYTKDNTEIIWGAEIGTWQRYLEATDEQKISRLYHYYKDNGSLLGGVKYINLCDPQETVPLPIDKY